jgi:hypothetical protein
VNPPFYLPILRFALLVLFATSIPQSVIAQGLSVNSCPVIDKRNNGNGQWGLAAGFFPNDPGNPQQNNPVARNVDGTPYQNVAFLPSAKTGYVNFYWDSQTPVLDLPVITRVWLTASGASSATLSAIKFGPPPPAVIVGNRYFFNTSFYGQNMPAAGKVTLEFANPTTGNAVFRCTYDLQNGLTATEPTISCAPTITTEPTNSAVCGNENAATFSVSTSGATAVQWQFSTDNFASFTNITNSAPYSTTLSAGTSTLTISSPTTVDGVKYRAVVTGTTGCGTSTSTIVTLIAKPKPTATFASPTLCGTSNQSTAVTLTGTAPWSITYTRTSGGIISTTTVNNITSSPFYLGVNGEATYKITSISDAFCANTYTAPEPSVSVIPTPTITPSNASACFGASTFSLSYTSSGTSSPTTYSISAGSRAMSGFVAVSGATLTSSPLSISIPTTAPAGTYDFYVTVTKSGCSSVSTPFTVTINRAPGVTATANNTTICAGTSITLTAAGADSYSWTSSPAGFTSSSATTTASPTTNTTYTVTGTSNGCSATSSVAVTVNSAPTITITPSATSICSSGERVTLTASGANAYSWAGPAGFTATGSFIVVSPTAASTYTVTGTSSNGCSNTASQLITIGGGLSLTISGTTSICEGSSTSLTASCLSCTSYTWTPSTSLSSSTAPTVTASPASTTTYTVTGTNAQGCSGTNSVTVTVTDDRITGITTNDQYVYYCGPDLATGGDDLTLSIQTSSSQNFTWAYASTQNGIYSDVSNSTNNIDITPTSASTSSSLRYRNPWGTTVPNQFFSVRYTTSGCTFTKYFYLSSLSAVSPVISSNQSICSNSTPNAITLLGVTTSGSANPTVTFNYQWESSTTSSSTGFTNIIGANSASYAAGPLTQTTWYRLKLTTSTSDCPGTYTSNAVQITVGTSITNNTLSITDACTPNTQISGQLPGGGSGSFTYAWEVSTTSSTTGFTTVANATGQNFTPSVPTQTTWYRRLVSSGGCSNATSAAIAIYPPITANEISTGQTICDGASLTALSTNPTGGQTGSTPSYLWFSSANNSTFNSTGVTTSTYTPPASVGTNYYYVRTTIGACVNNSNTATVIVNAKPTITTSSSASSVCSGQTVVLSASGAASYTWASSPSGFSSTSATPSVTPSATTAYTVTGTNAQGCTNASTITITYAGATPAAATLSSTSASICSGSSFNLGTITTGAEWYTVPEVNASFLLSSSTISSTGTYYAFAKSGSCYSTSSSDFTLTVINVAAPTVSATSLTYCAPATADLTILQPAAPAGVNYEWHTVNASPISNTLVSTPTSVSNGTYYLYAYSPAANCYGTASSGVTVTINSIPNPTLTSSSATPVCAPEKVNLTSYAAATSTLTYSWYSANDPTPANLVSDPTAVGVSGSYYLYGVNTSTNCRGAAAGSLSVTINSKPAISLSTPDAFCGPDARTITATVTGVTSPSYAWSLSTDGGLSWSGTLSNTGVYSGATTNALTISNASGLSGNYYRCSTTSDAAILVGESAPVITAGPVSSTILSAGTATMTVAFTGNADVQWQVKITSNGTFTDLINDNIHSGVNSTILLIQNAPSSMIGYQYRAVVYNYCGSLESTTSTLPVTWLSFTGQKAGNAVQLNWVTASEQNTKDFVVQHSQNAQQWQDLATLAAAGFSSSAKEYSYLHLNPIKGNSYNYYRILQRDLDGKFSYSKIVYILFSDETETHKVYPNPASDNLTIVLIKPQLVKLINQSGATVLQKQLGAGVNNIPVHQLPKGTYVVMIANRSYKVVIN